MSELLHFRNYFWKEGKPVGKDPSDATGETFKVITDPYRKRFSVESYSAGKFVDVVYDSNLFDFRHLKSAEIEAWQRECIDGLPNRSLIRNIDERVILMEEAHFEGDLCTGCTLYSPQGIWIATQKMHLTSKGDAFNGVSLMDKLKRPVLIKEYSIEEGAFSLLLQEKWVHP